MEFNGTFLASIISFLVFVYLMNKVLYAPMEKIVAERQRFVDENFENADKNYTKADELSQEREDKLASARNNARDNYLSSVNSYKEKHGDIVSEAQNSSKAELDEAYQGLENVSNETKEGLKARMSDLANDIVEKVLGYRSEVQGFDNNRINEILYR